MDNNFTNNMYEVLMSKVMDLAKENAKLKAQNEKLTNKVETMYDMLETMENYYTMSIDQFQAEFEIKDRIIKDLESQLIEKDMMQYVDYCLNKNNKGGCNHEI